MRLFFKRNLKEKDSQKYSSIDCPDHVESLTKDTFNEFIKKYPLSVIDFWGPWCAPCKTMLPRIRRLERLYHGRVAFGRVNTMDEKDLAKQYNIMGIPHFCFFHFNKKIGGATGLKSIGEMKSLIDLYLTKYY